MVPENKIIKYTLLSLKSFFAHYLSSYPVDLVTHFDQGRRTLSVY